MKNYAKSLPSFGAVILLFCLGPAAHAADIANPTILVATERLVGSPYEQTVLLAVPDGNGQHLGLIMNRPTSIELAALFPESTDSRRLADPVFFGGPVMSGALFAAIRAVDPPSNYSVSLMPGVFLVTDKDTIDRLVKTAPSVARYFTGFVVWGPTELIDEIRSGMWEIQPADANVLFRANPQQLWPDFARSRRHAAYY